MSKEIKFGTDGWRDVIADGFTFENVRTAANAIGTYILKNSSKNLPVLIGYDTRFLADEFAKSCAKELSNLGLNVYLSETFIPTPIIAYQAAQFKSERAKAGSNGAIQFTASHNPPKYCGLKYITNYGGPAPLKVTDEITRYINELTLKTNKKPSISKNINIFNPRNDYVTHLKSLMDFESIKKAGLKIVYDPMYGAGNGYLDSILKEAGCNTITIHNKKDPLFGGLLPEPREDFLSELKKSVTENKAHLGLATDGDADRLGAIDSDGTFFSPNKIASMLLRHLFKNKKQTGTVVRTLSTTHLLDHLAKAYDLQLIETQVGFKWICEEMRKENVLIGAEESGGISIKNHVPDKDAILAGMLLTEMIAMEKKTLSQIFNETLKDAKWNCINDKFDLHMNEKQKTYFISSLRSRDLKNLQDLQVASINTIEGVKYVFEDGSWFLARPSGTEPMARVYFEATSDKVLETMKKAIQVIVDDSIKL